ncbi:MAG: hypothetical protein MJZ06_05345 [Bacteroidaceae bacterium]|nr:hypothetical protein [Bacteroidaceae bacterium]
MINYSIVMRSVNGNLFEINQAKSRVGKFARHISSHGCVYSRADRFSAQNITGVNVVWDCQVLTNKTLWNAIGPCFFCIGRNP